MKRTTPRKITARKWVILGTTAVSVVGSSATAGPVANPAPTDRPGGVELTAGTTAATATASEGGEGGESGEGAVANGRDDEAGFLTDLGFMEGHALAGVKLYAMGEAALGVVHAGHPIVEKYDAVADELEERGFGRLRDQLVAMSEAADAGAPKEEVQALYDAVAATIAKVRASAKGGPVAELKSLAMLTRIAAEEYDAAFEAQKMVNLKEYQDSWGFFSVVKARADSLADNEDEAVATAARKIIDFAAEAEPTYGAVDGTSIFVIEPELIYGAAAKMEFAASAVK